MTPSIVTTRRQLTAVIKVASPFDRIAHTQRTARATLAAALPSLKTGALGHTCTRWTPPANGMLPMEIGLIVARPFAASGEVVPSELPAGRAAHFQLRGPFDGLPGAWQALFDWCKAERLSLAGINWEIYSSWKGADPKTLNTDLYALLA